MRLKQVEIHGFKSFADRTVIAFLPGITAIVGPNGSGKSNIADSLRWVMGEQNIRNLRGTKLEDVIFSGSESRKPLGMAEVTLVLDNSDGTLPLDFNEVAVTRRIYRSGEAEFLINRTPVRLKDIQELFYDTGLGKESYSIIGQGKIDSILSLRPEERRMVFEEAAGIMKYKNKKATAVRKLAETENNLLRVQDILEELKSQIGPLARQAEQARLYRQIQKELEKLEINYSHTQLCSMQSELANLAGEEEKLRQELDNLKKEEADLEKETEELKNRISVLEEEKNTTQNQLLECSTEKERALSELNLLAERCRFQKERLLELETFLAEQEKKLRALAEKKNHLSLQVTTGDEEKTRLSLAVQEGEELLAWQEAQIKEIRRRLEEKKDDLSRVLNELSTLKQEINGIEVHNDFRREKIAEHHEHLQELEDDLTGNTAESSALQKRIEEAEENLRRMEEEEKNLRSALEKSRAYLKQQAEKNQELREKIRAVESRIILFSEMEREHHGYHQGVKELLKAKKEPFYQEIHGVVADLIKVEKGYELAVEVALGGALQYMVINNDQAARAAIDYLKKNALGRVTFLPLNLIEARADRFQGLEDLFAQYNCRPAASVLRFDRLYQAIIFHLLGGTVIAPDLKTAVEVAKKTNKRYRLVTLDGEVVSPGGAMTGGKFKQQPIGLLSRKRTLADLNAEKRDLLAFMNRGLDEEKKWQEKITGLETALEEKKNRGQEVMLQINSLRRDLEALTQARGKILEQQEQAKMAVARLEREIAAQTAVLGEKIERRNRLTEEIERINREIKDLEARESQLTSNRESRLKDHSELAARLAGLQQEWAGKKESLQELEESYRELAVACEEKKEELSRIRDEIAHGETEKTILKRKAQKTLEVQAVLTEKLAGIKNRRQQAGAELAGKEEKLRGLNQRRGELTSLLHRVELETNKILMKQENLTAQLLEEYGENWRAKVEADWLPEPGCRQAIARLKKQLKEMEPVNLQAIEDYEKMAERVNFLTRQYEDLTAARVNLERVIKEIEKTICTRFVDTFHRVRKEFIALFEELFSGGRADLKLLEPENPLESGIEILAQPPGKRLQILSLLSGGERAMTAIALLFAVLRVKPSPFCILDEIDATLDNVNLRRFVELLKLFSKDIQFIMITHRRDTMEVAEALYGVTMEEKGVSKLISLEMKRRAV